MHIKHALIIIIISGIAGYVIEPMVIRKDADNANDKGITTKSGDTNQKKIDGTFTYIQPKEEPNPKAPVAPPAAPKVTKTPERPNKPTEVIPQPKPNFPITSLELDRPDKKSRIGSPNLEKAIDFAIKNDHFIGLVTLLEKDLYHPVQKNQEITPKQLSELADNPAWNHALNVYTLLQLF
ncbi:MAG: hypothetical protein HN759_04580, partial [Akkermansiaceae bacterium]|nr:hypothetical protein [Akkermansiaceae bacterium]